MLVGRYQLGPLLGTGAMGRVYRAVDTATGATVAVKLLQPQYAVEPTAVARLEREAGLVAMLESPYIVRLIDAGVVGNQPFLAMEYLPGPTLADVLKQRTTLTLPEALTVLLEIACALDAAHAHRIVHRDLKPGNIKLAQGHVKVMDFGIARAVGDLTLTATGTYMGTPAFSAPERADGRGDIRSDIYSSGLILYTLLAGTPPFHGSNHWAVLHAQRTQAVPPLPIAVPVAVEQILARCLAKLPEARYETPAQLVAAVTVAQATAGYAVPAYQDVQAEPAVDPEATLRAPSGDDDETIS